jgi:hypothetical protein
LKIHTRDQIRLTAVTEREADHQPAHSQRHLVAVGVAVARAPTTTLPVVTGMPRNIDVGDQQHRDAAADAPIVASEVAPRAEPGGRRGA